MKIFNFFIKEIFLKRILLVIGIFLLIFISNYLVFISARTAISTLEGYKEANNLNQEHSFISNLDPDENYDMGSFNKNDTQKIYDYLNKNFSYGIVADGFIVNPPNSYDMEVSCAYVNEDYYKLNEFKLAQGKKLEFDYEIEEDLEIPVLIGKGLSETYPLNSIIKIVDPALSKKVNLKVQGILKRDDHHSNIYALNSKQYYNFSIIIPVNKQFIDESNLGLGVQGLSDMIILNTSKYKIEDLKKIIYKNIGLKYNFFTQEENFTYFKEYYLDTLKSILIISMIIALILTFINVLSSLAGVIMMIKDFLLIYLLD